jgi:hypothetical protein
MQKNRKENVLRSLFCFLPSTAFNECFSALLDIIVVFCIILLYSNAFKPKYIGAFCRKMTFSASTSAIKGKHCEREKAL